MYCVIGSGPTAVAAAKALSGRELPVSIIDTSVMPDNSVEALRQRLSSAEPDDWRPEDLETLKRHTVPTSDGVEAKLDFGSDHVYQDVRGAPPFALDRATMLRSFARGGLSSVWGASILPYPEDELGAWPFEASVLREHYESVLKFMPQSGADDDLSTLFPWMSREFQEMPRTRQQDSLLQDLERSKQSLVDRGMRFGTARLAVDAEGASFGSACRRCGLCLYGCPYGLIYSSQTTLDQLRSLENVDFRPGLWVHSIEPGRSGVRIRARHIDTGQEESISAKRVFLATGVVETARIVLESTRQYDVPVLGLHSDRITLPLIRFRRDKGIGSGPLHTLSQVFLEILDGNIGEELIHVQIYGFNDLMRGSLAARLGRNLVRSSGLLDKVLLERLMVAFAYLHSSHSSSIEYVLRSDGQLQINGRPSDRARTASRRLCKKLRRSGLLFRGFFGKGKLHLPGGGNHSGGTFPMTNSPVGLQCDSFGELRGIPNLHIVDSSVLPSLSATTITLPAMANAHRIASEVL